MAELQQRLDFLHMQVQVHLVQVQVVAVDVVLPQASTLIIKQTMVCITTSLIHLVVQVP